MNNPDLRLKDIASRVIITARAVSIVYRGINKEPHRESKLRTILSILTGCLACLIVVSIAAAEGAIDLPRYDYEIKLRAVRQALTKVDMNDLAAEINLAMPVRAPKLLTDQITNRIEKKLEVVLEEKFPSSRYDEIEQAASEKYRMFKIGEFVSIDGIQRGEWRRIEGYLDAITNDRIKLGDIYYARQDLTELTMPKFYREDHEEAVRKYKAIHTRNFDLAKKEFREEQRRLFANQEWPKFGYVYSRRMRRWVPAEAVLRNRYQKKLKGVIDELHNGIKEAVYADNGYVLDSLNQWVLESDVAVTSNTSMLAKVRQFLLLELRDSSRDGGARKQYDENPDDEWEDEWDDEDQGNTGRGNRTIQAVSAPVAKQDLRPKQPKNVGDLYDE